jgi:hypothetical protein
VGFVDEVVDDIEQMLQLSLSKGSAPRRDGIVGGVLRSVPLEANLRRNIAELLLAERNPPVSAVTDIRTNIEIALLYERNVDNAIGVCCDLRSARN